MSRSAKLVDCFLRFTELPGDNVVRQAELPSPYPQASLAQTAIIGYQEQFGSLTQLDATDPSADMPFIPRSLQGGALGAVVRCLEPIERRSVIAPVNDALGAIVAMGTHEFTGNRLPVGVFASLLEVRDVRSSSVMSGVAGAFHIIDQTNSLSAEWQYQKQEVTGK